MEQSWSLAENTKSNLVPESFITAIYLVLIRCSFILSLGIIAQIEKGIKV